MLFRMGQPLRNNQPVVAPEILNRANKIREIISVQILSMNIPSPISIGLNNMLGQMAPETVITFAEKLQSIAIQLKDGETNE